MLRMMTDEEFDSTLHLPTAPITMTDALDVVKDKEAAIALHETRFSFV